MDLVERQTSMHVMLCCYIYWVKTEVGIEVSTAAEDFRQAPNAARRDTYASVVSLPTVCPFFKIANSPDFERDQTHVVTAFLNGNLRGKVYIEVRTGFCDLKRPGLV